MANTLSAKKRVRASLRKRLHNRATRSAVKTLVARARKLGGTTEGALTGEEVRRAISALDKAAEKGILHRNNAARRKARLMRALAATEGGEASARPAPARSPRERAAHRARPA